MGSRLREIKPDDDRQDGNDHRDDGAADEEVSHNGYSFSCLGRSRRSLLALGGGLGHLRGGHRLHRRAFAHLLQALDHDAFARLQPFHDQHAVPDRFADLDGALGRLVVRADDPDEILALQFRHRPLRHKDAVGPDAQVHLDPSEHARAKQLLRIWELRRAPATCRSSHPPRDQ